MNQKDITSLSNRPNFFIIGAPRSGTTALTKYLNSHPNIFMSTPKEPLFFADDYSEIRKIHTLDAYLQLFIDANEKHKIIGEASTWYLYSQNAVKNIYNFNIEAKIIIMLRNPVDLCYAIHSDLLFMLYEDEKNFEKAWDLQDERKNGLSIPINCRMASFLQYSEVCSLGKSVNNVLSVFPKSQVKLILFDDFINSTTIVYQDIIRFLDLPQDNRKSFPIINPNRRHRSFFIARHLMYPSQILLETSHIIKKIFHLKRLGIAEKLLLLNKLKEQRKPLSDNFIIALKNHFKDDIENLSGIINKDLKHWVE